MPKRKNKGKNKKENFKFAVHFGKKAFDDAMNQLTQVQDKKRGKLRETLDGLKKDFNKQKEHNEKEMESHKNNLTAKLQKMKRALNSQQASFTKKLLEIQLDSRQKQLATENVFLDTVNKQINEIKVDLDMYTKQMQNNSVIFGKWIDINEIKNKHEHGLVMKSNINGKDSGYGIDDEKSIANINNDVKSLEDLIVQSEIEDRNMEVLKEQLHSTRVIVCVGKTGLGKSTFLNRICGDLSDKGDKGEFVVGHGRNSCTNAIIHKMIEVKCESDKNQDHDIKSNDESTNAHVNFCVVDTPGYLDTKKNDQENMDNITNYLRGCGGINAFLVFINLDDGRIDQSYIDILKMYSKVLHNNKADSVWWDHVILIGTKYDKWIRDIIEDNEFENDEEKQEHVKNELKKIREIFRQDRELNIPARCVIPIIASGRHTYKEAVKELLQSVPVAKYNAAQIQGSDQICISQQKIIHCRAKIENLDFLRTIHGQTQQQLLTEVAELKKQMGKKKIIKL